MLSGVLCRCDCVVSAVMCRCDHEVCTGVLWTHMFAPLQCSDEDECLALSHSPLFPGDKVFH